MKTWEYCWAHSDPSNDPVGEINQLGKEGWEVCAYEPENKIHNGLFFLKRERRHPARTKEMTLAELVHAVEESKKTMHACDMLIGNATAEIDRLQRLHAAQREGAK